MVLLCVLCPGEGILAIKAPWPCMMRTVYGDHERFQQTYFSAFKGYYFTGGSVVNVVWLLLWGLLQGLLLQQTQICCSRHRAGIRYGCQLQCGVVQAVLQVLECVGWCTLTDGGACTMKVGLCLAGYDALV